MPQMLKNRLMLLAGLNEDEVKGQANINLYKSLGITDFNPQKFSQIVNNVKKGIKLNNLENKILADVFIALMKTNDTTLLTKIFQNLKRMQGLEVSNANANKPNSNINIGQ